MPLFLPSHEIIQNQIEDFNILLSGNSKIKYCEDIIFPYVNYTTEEILFSKRFEFVLLLYILYPDYKNELHKLFFLHHSVWLNIQNGHFENAYHLLNNLVDEFEWVKGNARFDYNQSIYLNAIITVLIAHELGHYKYYLHSDLKETELDNIRRIIPGNEYKGLRGLILKRSVRILYRDNHRLEELACDYNGGESLVWLLNKGIIKPENIETVVEQITRVFVLLQFWKNLNVLSEFTVKQHLQDHTFDIFRILVINYAICQNIDSLSSNMIDSMKKEIFNYNIILSKTAKLVFSNSNFGSTLSNTTSTYDFDLCLKTRNEIKTAFYHISDTMMKYFESIIV